ncbi:MAG: hypothetical protein Q8R57_09375 [Bacteroidota bacterium]|nr:hypothetical protein [Bacteroidota bacterium]
MKWQEKAMKRHFGFVKNYWFSPATKKVVPKPKRGFDSKKWHLNKKGVRPCV